MATWPFVFALLLNLLNLFHVVFEITVYSDLQIDYLNPVDAARRINPYVLPSMAVQSFVSTVMLLTGHWWSFAFNLPLLAWHIRKYTKKDHLVDATEIFRRLSLYQNDCYFRLAYYLLFFFWYLFRLISSIVVVPQN